MFFFPVDEQSGWRHDQYRPPLPIELTSSRSHFSQPGQKCKRLKRFSKPHIIGKQDAGIAPKPSVLEPRQPGVLMFFENSAHRSWQIGRGAISWDYLPPKPNFLKIVLNDQYMFTVCLLLCGFFAFRSTFSDFRADKPDQF